VVMRHVVGAAAVAGIGFTVSLFVAELAFADVGLRDAAKVGILLGSLLASTVGYVLLRLAPATSDANGEDGLA
jgi:NhaA family Na+:H+ antiporter